MLTRKEYYQDWLSDNKLELAKQFIELYEDDFKEFCEERFAEIQPEDTIDWTHGG